MTCKFARGSTASGCRIRFVDARIAGRIVKETEAIRIGGSLLASVCEDDLPLGLFRVLASDISSSGMVDDRVSVESLITIAEQPSKQIT